MSFTLGPSAGGLGNSGPAGYSYSFLVAGGLGDDADPRAAVQAVLEEIRFSGWIAPAQDGWVPAVAAAQQGTAATGRRSLAGVGELVAARTGATVLAFQVVRDRQLLIVGWAGGTEIGRYVSDPAYGVDDDEVLPDPIGVEYAGAFAAACGTAGNADELAEMLAAEQDPENDIESERLLAVLRLLRLPDWLVASASLPKDVPGGPRAADLIRLGAGRRGLAGRLAEAATRPVRRRRRPPSDVPEGHRAGPIDPWLL